MDGAGEASGIVEQRDLEEFSAPAGGMLFNVGETRRTEGDVLRVRLRIPGDGRTSLQPPLHMHFRLPLSSDICEWKRNLVFTEKKKKKKPDCGYSESSLKAGERRLTGLHPHWFPRTGADIVDVIK